MGSWFSSPDYVCQMPDELKPSPSDWAALLERMEGRSAIPPPRTREEKDAHLICRLANWVLKHYNSTHPGAEFQYLEQPAADTKAACIGFRRDLWYHVGFSATRKDDHNNTQRFFAELRFDPCADILTVETCTVLDNPLSCFRSSCAFCPEESKILHPSDDTQFGCGKAGQENEFFREWCEWDGNEKTVFSKSDMLEVPFWLGGRVPRYRLVDRP